MVVFGPLCSFAEEIQTQICYIYNINEVICMFPITE